MPSEQDTLAELHMVDHRHGEERAYCLRLTAAHLRLIPLDENGEEQPAPRVSMAGRLMATLRGEKSIRDPYPLMDTDVRLDNSSVRIRLGTANSLFTFHDFDRTAAGKFLMAYLQAKREITTGK